MSLYIGDNFKYGGRKYLDDRQSFDTLEAMKNFDKVPDGFITYCKEDGKRYEFKSSNNINELTGKWTEFIVNVDIPEIEIPEIEVPEIDIDSLYHMGADTPEKDSSIWFSTGVETAASGISLDNPLIVELFACIRELQAKVQKLEEDVEYLKINGGGSIPEVPPIEPDPDIPPIDPDPEPDPDEPGYDESLFRIIMEDGSGGFLLEDGSGIIILEESVAADKETNLLLEDGFNLLLEDGDLFLCEVQDVVIVPDKVSNITLENGFNLLMEDGSLILLEESVVTPPSQDDSNNDPILLLENGEKILLESGKNILMER